MCAERSECAHAGIPRGNQMGKKSKKGKAPACIRHHVAVPGEFFQILVDYVKEYPAEVITEQPPGQSASHHAPESECLTDRTRLFLFLIIDMIDDLVNEGICLEELKAQNIVILSNGRPKLNGVEFVERKDLDTLMKFKEKVSENYLQLSGIFSREFLDKVPFMPADVTHLLFLMKQNAWEMRLLINYHAATVPRANILTLYIRVYNYTWEILRTKDPDGYSYVLKNMEFDPMWRQLVPYNRHLQRYYQNTSYLNTLPPGTEAFLLKERRLVARFKRNGASHPLELALDMDPSSEDGMLYSQCVGLGHIYQSHFSRLTYSLQGALQAIKKLRFVEIKSLFSNSCKEYKEIV
ncbi:unnamed protein product [Alopecurus aequalis]